MSVTTSRIRAAAPLLVALGALGGCGSSGHSPAAASNSHSRSAGSASTALAAIKRAAYVTQTSEGLKLSLKSTVQVAGHTIGASGSGYLITASKEGKITIDAAGRSIEEVIDFPYVYARLPMPLAGGKPWVKLNAGNIASSLGISSSSASASNPTEQLLLLRAAGSVKELGSETLRGIPTTHYAARIQLRRLAEVAPAGQRAAAQGSARLLEGLTGLSELSMEVWVDAQGHVRRVQMTIPVCTPGGRLTSTSTVEFFDFGPQPAVTPPPASEVSEAGSALESAAKHALSALHCAS